MIRRMFIRQPNGLLARFSAVVMDFTDCNMEPEQAVAVYLKIDRISEEIARRRVHMALVNDGRDWLSAIDDIRYWWGDERADLRIEELSKGKVNEKGTM